MPPVMFRTLFVAILWLTSTGVGVTEPQRPLLFVPGILGSQLYDRETPIWGSDVIDSLKNLQRIKRIDASQDAAKRDGLSDCLLTQYHTLSSYWSTNVYKAFVAYLENTLGYTQGKDLFIFCYDWRRSNLSSASLLADFIKNNQVLAQGQFDIIAHSMGGLVTRAAILQNREISSRIKYLIEMGIPHRGSVNILAPLVDGWGWLPRRLAGGMETIRQVAFSFQSLYELLPYYENCCGVGFSPPNTPHIDFLDIGDWSKYLRWLYPTSVNAISFEESVIKPGLLRAADLRAIMESKLPDNIRLRVVAGRWTRTGQTIYVLPDQKKFAFAFTDGQGDGTVHLLSARSAYADDPYVSAAEHVTLYDDRYVLQLVREILEDRSIPPIAGRRPPSLSGHEIAGIDLKIEPSILQVGQPAKLSMLIELVPGAADSGPITGANASLLGPNGTKNVALNIRQESSNRIILESDIIEDEEGTYVIRPQVDGLSGVGPLERSVVMLK
jgi:pimeloyl-ACP methyl ester carboxylesterase